MRIEERGMQRKEFRRIKHAELIWRNVNIECFKGYAGLLDILETDGPWTIDSVCGKVTIADKGFVWLQCTPSDESWWLTVMYDMDGKLVQYYFDIIGDKWISESGEPRFKDMFIDIVMGPDGTWQLLDEDELEAALINGIISEAEYSDARYAACNILERLDGNELYWRELCGQLYKALKYC